MNGAYLFLADKVPAPEGFTKIGTTATTYIDLKNRSRVLKLNIYQLNYED